MQTSLATETVYAVGREPAGLSTGLYTFYKIMGSDVLTITAEKWSGRCFEPRQLRCVDMSLTDVPDPATEVRSEEQYAEIEEETWVELLGALCECRTCQLSVTDKLE